MQFQSFLTRTAALYPNGYPAVTLLSANTNKEVLPRLCDRFKFIYPLKKPRLSKDHLLQAPDSGSSHLYQYFFLIVGHHSNGQLAVSVLEQVHMAHLWEQQRVISPEMSSFLKAAILKNNKHGYCYYDCRGQRRPAILMMGDRHTTRK
jgi:hypothetical protein